MTSETDKLSAATKARLAQWEMVQHMTDEQLSEAVHERVWGVLMPEGYEDLVLSELLQRFERMAGVERSEDGGVKVKKVDVSEDFPDALAYVKGAVAVAIEAGDDFVRVRTERVNDLIAVADGLVSPRNDWRV